MAFFPYFDGGQQGTDPDPGSAQVVDFVNLQAGINLAGTGQNITDLVRGDGIQPASEGIQLYQVQILMLPHIACRGIETGVVHPLVGYDQGSLGTAQVGDGILGEHRYAKGGDQFRDAVVDLGINVIGPAGKDDSPFSGFVQVPEDFLPFLHDVSAGPGQLCPAGRCRLPDLLCGKFRKFCQQGFGDSIQIPEGHKRIAQLCLPVADLLHIVFYVFGIGGDNGTIVVIVSTFHFVPLVKKGRIEHKIHIVADEPHHMAMRKLGRITFGFAGNGFYAQLVYLAVGTGGQDDPVAQPGEKYMPEGIVLIHVQDSGNSHHAPPGLVCFQGRVGEESLQFIFVQIGHIVGIFLAADSAFAAVAGDKLASAGKFVDGEPAAVGTAPAFGHACFIFQGTELFIGKHGGLILVRVILPGDEGRTEGSHNAGDIGTDGLAPRNFFKTTENRIIIESTALYHDLPSQLGGVGHLDYLEQGVLDNGISQSGRYIGHTGAFFLGLFDPGIHENGTAGAQINGVRGKNCLVCKLLHFVVQGFCKSFYKRTAAGRACLIQQHAVHGSVLDFDTFHILAADVQNAVHIGVEKGGGAVMGHGLHFPVIQKKRGLHQSLAITGGAGAHDPDSLGEGFVNLFQGANGGL